MQSVIAVEDGEAHFLAIKCCTAHSNNRTELKVHPRAPVKGLHSRESLITKFCIVTKTAETWHNGSVK